MFGVEYFNEDKFRLYPKLFIDNRYFDYIVPLINGNTSDLSIFIASSNTTISKGLMVKNKKCYYNLVDLFKLVKAPVISEVEDTKSMYKNAPIHGFILEIWQIINFKTILLIKTFMYL